MLDLTLTLSCVSCACVTRAPVLPVVVFIGTVIAESVEEFVHGKPSQTIHQRVQPTAGVMRISRALYNQIDNDMLQLLASSRDFDESGAASLCGALAMHLWL